MSLDRTPKNAWKEVDPAPCRAAGCRLLGVETRVLVLRHAVKAHPLRSYVILKVSKGKNRKKLREHQDTKTHSIPYSNV